MGVTTGVAVPTEDAHVRLATEFVVDPHAVFQRGDVPGGMAAFSASRTYWQRLSWRSGKTSSSSSHGSMSGNGLGIIAPLLIV